MTSRGAVCPTPWTAALAARAHRRLAREVLQPLGVLDRGQLGRGVLFVVLCVLVGIQALERGIEFERDRDLEADAHIGRRFDGRWREAIERIASSEIDELVVTDTIPLREDARACKKIRQLSVAGLIAETILRIYTEESVSSLFIE